MLTHDRRWKGNLKISQRRKTAGKRKKTKHLPELFDIISDVISSVWFEHGSNIIFDEVTSSFWVECGSNFMLVLLSVQVILICVILKHDLHLTKLYALTVRFTSNWNRVMYTQDRWHVNFQ